MFYEFRSIKFSHIYRKGNVYAYLLAKHAISMEDFSICIDKNPYFLKQTLLHDVFVANIS